MQQTAGVFTLEDLEIPAIIGVYPEEQCAPQPLFVSLRWPVDSATIAQTDNLKAACDYDEVAQFCRDFVAATPCALLETLGEHLLTALLAHFQFAELELSLSKPAAIPDAQTIRFTLWRSLTPTDNLPEVEQ